MNYFCIECKQNNKADVICINNKNLSYCFKHFGFSSIKHNQYYSFVDIQEWTQNTNKVLLSRINHLRELRKIIIFRSKSVTDIIEVLTKNSLESIKNNINFIENFIETREIVNDLNEFFDESQTLYLKTCNLPQIIETLNKNLCLSMNNQEVTIENQKLFKILNTFQDFENFVSGQGLISDRENIKKDNQIKENPKISGNSVGHMNGNLRPGRIWLCSSCKTNNHAEQNYCQRCKTKKHTNFDEHVSENLISEVYNKIQQSVPKTQSDVVKPEQGIQMMPNYYDQKPKVSKGLISKGSQKPCVRCGVLISSDSEICLGCNRFFLKE